MDVVVLLSGGVDSTVVASLAKDADRLRAAVFINYGQPALVNERDAAVMWCARNATELLVFDVDGGVLMGDTMRIGVGITGARVVPGRNALLLACAVSAAVSVGATEVWYGAMRGDEADYPDCRESFVQGFSAMSEATYGVVVRAPFLERGLTKQGVIELGQQLGVDLAATWSCYEPDGRHPCGRCNSCLARVGV